METFGISAAHLSPINIVGVRTEGTFTAEEAMTQGKLGGWDVRAWPAAAVGPNEEIVFKPDMVDLVRTNPDTGEPEALSRMSMTDRYQIVQNEEHAAFLNTLVDEAGANFEMAGAIDGGRKVLLSMRLPQHIQIGGVDPINTSLLAVNSFDGSTPFTLTIAPIRYACSNVLNIALKGRQNTIKARHTTNMNDNLVTRAREALNITFAYLDKFQEEAEKLLDKELTEAQFEEIINREFGPKPDMPQKAATRAQHKVEALTDLFVSSTHANVRNTAWAGFNALAEWNDHFSPVRGDQRELSRATKALLDPSFKEWAFNLMSAV